MGKWISAIVLLATFGATACSGGLGKFPTTDSTLKLSRVVLYRNGVGYFERNGVVTGEILRIKVRKDQINDVLKSLTVVRRRGGQAVSVSMPLDPQSWANAALATLAPGRGNLAQVLDALRGTHVELSTAEGSVKGRIVMVEELSGEADSNSAEQSVPINDHRITLMDGTRLGVLKLSKVQGITLRDGDLAMQFHRTLDASAGEGMFQQVEVALRLAGAEEHDLVVSYVVSAPMWKPTYRVVLPEGGKGKALLQGWAVVDNTSGEDWPSVRLALTSGAPIAFRYDLHTPRDVDRSDLTETAVRKRAAVAMGESTYNEPPAPPPPPPPPDQPKGGQSGLAEEDKNADHDSVDDSKDRKADEGEGRRLGAGDGKKVRRADTSRVASTTRAPAKASGRSMAQEVRAREASRPEAAPTPSAAPTAYIDLESLRRSTAASTRAVAVSGLTQFDLSQPVTVPEGTSTMVAVVNQEVEGEETYMFRPGGAGQGYETNPYRVVRFRNTTPFVLESGPIAIYSGGSFVGEGLSEPVGANTSATIPFAVASDILVTSQLKQDGDQMRLVKIVRGVLEVETFARKTTQWNAKTQGGKTGLTVLIRHPKAWGNYSLNPRPTGAEDLPDAYLVPLGIPKGKYEASVEVVEQSPSNMRLTIWDGRAPALIENLLLSTNLGADARSKLEPIAKLRREIGKIDTQVEGLQRQKVELDQRAEQTRENLQALKKDPAAGALRKRLSDRLEQFTKDGDRIGREIVDLQSRRLEKKIGLEDLLENLDLQAPVTPPIKPTS